MALTRMRQQKMSFDILHLYAFRNFINWKYFSVLCTNVHKKRYQSDSFTSVLLCGEGVLWVLKLCLPFLNMSLRPESCSSWSKNLQVCIIFPQQTSVWSWWCLHSRCLKRHTRGFCHLLRIVCVQTLDCV